MPIKVVVASDYDHMSELAFDVLHSRIETTLNEKDEFVLGLATGNSPVGLYKQFQCAANQGKFDCRRIRSFNLDEYVGLPGDDPQERTLHPASYSYFMMAELFGPLTQKFRKTQLPAGNLIDQRKLRAELQNHPGDWTERGGDSGRAVVIKRKAKSDYLRWIRSHVLDGYGEKIRAAGGVDLQVIGVGGRGHVAFHEAGIPFSVSGTMLVKLDENTIFNAVADGHFPSPDDVPRFAVSMSVKQVFRAKHVLCVASGRRKVAPVVESLLGPLSVCMPLSYGKKYADEGGNLTLVVDKVVGEGLLERKKELKQQQVEIIDRRRGKAKLRVADILLYRDVEKGCYRCR
jgi:glucosamine-6-phosphate deaminase